MILYQRNTHLDREVFCPDCYNSVRYDRKIDAYHCENCKDNFNEDIVISASKLEELLKKNIRPKPIGYA